MHGIAVGTKRTPQLFMEALEIKILSKFKKKPRIWLMFWRNILSKMMVKNH